MKKIIRLTESELNNMISQSVKKVIKEGSPDWSVYNKWNDIIEMMGADAVLSELYNYLNSDQIEDFIEWMKKNYDIDFGQEEDTYDEFEDDDEY